MMNTNNNSWPLPISKPEDVGISSERLARIRPAMQKFIDEKKDPNFITMVIRHGKIVHYEAQGYMDFESKKPVQKDTIYRLWSNTKPMTGVATMMCLEEGLLNLDDPLSNIYPLSGIRLLECWILPRRRKQAAPLRQVRRPPSRPTGKSQSGIVCVIPPALPQSTMLQFNT